MGKEHLRQYQKVYPVPIDSELGSSLNYLGRCGSDKTGNFKTHSNALGQLDHGYSGFVSTCYRTTIGRGAASTSTLERLVHHLENYVQAHCWPGDLSVHRHHDSGVSRRTLHSGVSRLL